MQTLLSDCYRTILKLVPVIMKGGRRVAVGGRFELECPGQSRQKRVFRIFAPEDAPPSRMRLTVLCTRRYSLMRRGPSGSSPTAHGDSQRSRLRDVLVSFTSASAVALHPAHTHYRSRTTRTNLLLLSCLGHQTCRLTLR